MDKITVSKHGFTEPRFRGCEFPQSGGETAKRKEVKAMKEWAVNNPKQPSGFKAEIRLKRGGKVIKSAVNSGYKKIYGKAYDL